LRAPGRFEPEAAPRYGFALQKEAAQEPLPHLEEVDESSKFLLSSDDIGASRVHGLRVTISRSMLDQRF
jgi:hypothetical protein